MAKKPKLTVKEAKLVKGIVAGKTKQKAGIDAGYSGKPETVSVTVSDVLKKTKVQDALQAALEKAGITPDIIVAPVAEALTHEDLDMRLKGHDRATKIVQPRAESVGTIIFNKGDIVKDKYVKD